MIADARPIVYGPRSCTNLDGEPKASFQSRGAARRFLRVRGDREGLRPYPCPGCGRYHNGHPA